MIKGDVVYIYDDDKIKRTQVESVKDSVIDGKTLATRYKVATIFADSPEWVKSDKLYSSPEDLIKKLKEDAIKEVEDRYKDFDQDIVDTRFKDGRAVL